MDERMSSALRRFPGSTHPAIRRGRASLCRPALALACAALLAGCVSYEPEPLVPGEILRELRALEPPRPQAEGDGITPNAAAAWALRHNLVLQRVRAQLGVADSLIVQAGLLSDPQVGWNGMDALAQVLDGGEPERVDFLTGIGLSWNLPRPGEVGARVGVAEARRDQALQSVLDAEWRLVRDVRLAFLDVVAEQARLELLETQVGLARRTADFFTRARRVGGATAIQENLAASELAVVEQRVIRARGALAIARKRFNELLGVDPAAEIPLAPMAELQRVAPEERDPRELVEAALEGRPDLARRLAAYRAAEEGLRLEIKRQFPQLTLGIGLSVVLPIFTRFNRPAIRTALARRVVAGRALREAVHALRAEIHETVLALRNARREVGAIEERLLPRLEQSLRLTDQAFRAREVTLVEILTVQRQVLDVRSTHLEARIRAARARLLVDMVTGEIPGKDAAELEEKE